MIFLSKLFEFTTGLTKSRFHSLRNKMISSVLVINYHFDFRLQFDIKKICIDDDGPMMGEVSLETQLH